MKFKKILYATLVGVLCSSTANAGSVFLAGDSNIFGTTADNEILFQNVFNNSSVANFSSRSLAGLGTTATQTSYGSSSTITSSSLSGNDFMIFGYNDTNGVSESELFAITEFYNDGGSLFLFGEGNSYFSSLNSSINSILTAIGSSMSLSLTANLDNSGYTTFNNTAASSPYNTGVNSWQTAYAAQILLGDGTSLVQGVADNGFGVALAYEEHMSPVPVPAAAWLFGSALIGFAAMRRKKLKTV